MPRKAGEIEKVKSDYGQRYRTDEQFRRQVLERLKQKVACEHCGKWISKVNLKRHQGSKKCLAGRDSKVTTKVNIQPIKPAFKTLESLGKFEELQEQLSGLQEQVSGLQEQMATLEEQLNQST